MIFRHLTQNLSIDKGVILKRFISFTNAEFIEYLNDSGTYFIMCHDGAKTSAVRSSPTLQLDSGHDLQAQGKDQLSLHGLKESASSLSAARHQRISFRGMILWFIGNRCNVALINELHCADSKVCSLKLPLVYYNSNSRPGDDCGFRPLATSRS